MKRLLFAFLLFIAAPAVFALSDIGNAPHRSAIELLQERGIVSGYSDGTFRPDVPINRAEYLKILMLAVLGESSFTESDPYCFVEFYPPAAWYFAHACAAKRLGIINGYPDGTFRGDRTINMAEALKMAMEAWDLPQAVYIRAPDHWYDQYMDGASGTGLFDVLPREPGKQLTRGEAAALLVALDAPIADVSGSPNANVPVVVPKVSATALCGNGILETGEQCDDGNLLLSDGCSDICIIVPEPVRHGAMRLEQKAEGSATITLGSKDVRLLGFDALAGRQDVYLTHLVFAADVGSLSSAQNYKLYMDRDSNGTAEFLMGSAVPQGNYLTFDGLNILLRDGSYRYVELRADIPSSGSPSAFSVRFATERSDYVLGIDTEDGRDLSGIETDDSGCQLVSICWIAVYTQDSRLITPGDRGNLYVTQDSAPVRNHQLLLGARSDVLLRVEFLATGEDIEVTDFALGGGVSSISALELYDEGSSIPFATAKAVSCSPPTTTRFCADTSFVVPRDVGRKVLVRAVLNADTLGGTSGGTVALTVSAATSGTVAVEAQGAASLMELTQTDGDGSSEGEIFIGRTTAGGNQAITGPTHDIVAAKITQIANSNIDPDGTVIPIGTDTIGQFRFTAASHGNSMNGLNDVVIESLQFLVSASNVTVSSTDFVLFNAGNQNTTASCAASGTTNAITVTCSGLDASAVSTAIEQGTFIDLGLRAMVTDSQVQPGNSQLQVQLQNLGSRSTPGTVVWNDEVQTLQWVDVELTTVRSTRYEAH